MLRYVYFVDAVIRVTIHDEEAGERVDTRIVDTEEEGRQWALERIRELCDAPLQ